MKYSQSLIVTKKDVGNEIESKSHELSLKAGLVHQLGAGLYDFLPLGQIVLKNIERIIREEMEQGGALEVSFPIVQPLELWKESGRYTTYGDEMLRFNNREGRELCFGPTHEEAVSQCVRDVLDSYKQLPFTLYQIGRKFRDEKRPRHGLLRCREFIMKDAYSFDIDATEMIKTYQRYASVYKKIFTRMGLRFVSVEANPGEIGGSGSEEFLAYSKSGEDKFSINSEGEVIKIENSEPASDQVHVGIEIGHIFQLGQVYSQKMNVSFNDYSGKKAFPFMGCYGIGVSRLLPTLIEQHHDAEGIIWPKEIAPYKIIIIPAQNIPSVQSASEKIYHDLVAAKHNPLWDDRNCGVGIKFKDADLIGIPIKIIIGSSNLENNQVEIEYRSTRKKTFCSLDNLKSTLVALYAELP